MTASKGSSACGTDDGATAGGDGAVLWFLLSRIPCAFHCRADQAGPPAPWNVRLTGAHKKAAALIPRSVRRPSYVI